MSVSVITSEDGKVSCKTAEGSVINITISQRSIWDSINDRLDNKRKIPSEASSTVPMSPTSNVKATVLPVVLGVSQFPLGLMGLAVGLITVQTRSFPVFFTGAPFWMGIPLMLAGLCEVMAYIKNHGFWVFLSYICQLLIFCVSVAGLVLTVDSRLYGFEYHTENDPCERLLNNMQSRTYQSYDQPKNNYGQYDQDNSNQILKLCQQTFNLFKNLSYGVLIVLLIIGSWGVISSSITIIYRLKRLCEFCCSYKELAEEYNEPLEKTAPAAITV